MRWPKSLGFCHPIGKLDGVPDLCFHHAPVLVFTAIWGVKQQMQDLCLSLPVCKSAFQASKYNFQKLLQTSYLQIWNTYIICSCQIVPKNAVSHSCYPCAPWHPLVILFPPSSHLSLEIIFFYILLWSQIYLHIYVTTYLAYFNWENGFHFHIFCWKWQDFILHYGSLIFHHVYQPHFLSLRFIPYLGYYD